MMKSFIRLTLFALIAIIALAIAFVIYANLSIQVEVSHVNTAIKRDCLIDLVVKPDEIAEPGVVFRSYEINGTPMELICQGPNWTCQCSAYQRKTPSPIHDS